MKTLSQLLKFGQSTNPMGGWAIITKALGRFKNGGTSVYGGKYATLNDEWIQEYKLSNGFGLRIKYAWAVLRGKAIAFELS